MFDKVYNAVRIIFKEQKQKSLKISELEKRIETNDKALNEEKDQTDKRFDSAIDRFENVDIEEKNCDITNKLSCIEELLKKVNEEIEELEKKVEKDDKNDIKQCRFDRVGFCNKGVDQCNFVHVPETCNFYLQHGYCNKVVCSKDILENESTLKKVIANGMRTVDIPVHSGGRTS